MKDIRKKSLDPAVEYFLPKAFERGIDLIWDRYEASQPLDGFGELGLYCHDCLQGPCRINPFGDGLEKGICGQNRDSFVANRYLKASTMGALSRINHALDLLQSLDTLIKNLKKEKVPIDSKKVKDLLKTLGIKTAADARRVLQSIIQAASNDIQDVDASDKWLSAYLSNKTLQNLKEQGVLPIPPLYKIGNSLQRSQDFSGEDCFPTLLRSFQVSLAAYKAMHVTSDILDLFFGSDSIRSSESNIGVLRENAVNIVLNGGMPIDTAERLVSLVKRQNKKSMKGADEGIRLYAIGESDILQSLEIPVITNSGSSEIALLTGAVDCLVMGEECSNPSLIALCKKFHTEVLSIKDFDKNAEAVANEIIEKSVKSYKTRGNHVDIPSVKTGVVDGFNGRILNQSLKFIADSVSDGTIKGIAVFGGSSSVGNTDGRAVEVALELLKENVLCLAYGEEAISFAKMGLLDPESSLRYCGKKLKQFLLDLGKKTGTGKGLPPVLSFGSSSEMTMAIDFLSAVASRKKVEIKQLPAAGVYLEAGQEKDITDINILVALGIPVFVGSSIPIGGSGKVEKILTGDLFDLFGASIIYDPDEYDSKEIARKLLKILEQE